MTGYKRVNFYELCRLCATNREKTKIHIFKEAGRKMRLQSMIRTCFDVKISETDCLPKVVCLDCLRYVEESFAFRKKCMTSENMLSTYFNNYRHTDDFKKSGQVYIKALEARENDSESIKSTNINVSVNINGEVIKISHNEAKEKVEEPGKIAVVVNPVGVQTPNMEYIDVPVQQNYNFQQDTIAIAPKIEIKSDQDNPVGVLTSNIDFPTCNFPQEAIAIAPKITEIKSDQNQTQNKILKTFSCKLCTKVFKRREHLYQHVKLHTGFRPFICEHCKKSFVRKEHLNRHMACHSGQRNFLCHVCLKSFTRNDNLLKHKKTHEKKGGYECKICGQQFDLKRVYVAHKCESKGAYAPSV